MQAESSHYPESVQEWLQTPLGEALLRQEAREVEEAFDGIFGEQCLQLGMWGEERTFLRFARTQRCALIAEAKRRRTVCNRRTCTGCRWRTTRSMLCFLPHTLDYSDRPHAILREVDVYCAARAPDHPRLQADGCGVCGGWCLAPVCRQAPTT